ncbi:MAG: glycosyltransferase family 4 protein [Treponema sp.]|nr:glycosyltransferase family 4 protein [Treponema sp.]
MKICIFTNHFYPEDFKVNDIAFELAKLGYDVTVLTAIPDYPKGKFYDGYSLFKRRREIVNGVNVIRLPIMPRGKGGAIRLVLNYLSYYFCLSIFTFFHSFKYKYDRVFVHLTSPFFVGVCARKLAKRQQIPLLFWVLDLWPESLISAGGISNPLIIKPQIKMVQKVYNQCTKILISSKGFEKSICEKGNYKDKLVYFPNWAEDVKGECPNDFDINTIGPFASRCKDDFVLLFAGNIGEAQNLDAVLEACKLLKDKTNIKFVFVGDGRRKESLELFVKDNELQKTVFFIGRYPIQTMPVFMNAADVLMFALKDELCFNLTVPAKVQFYMSQGKPILAMINGDGAELVKEANCGLSVNAGDAEAFAKAVEKMSAMQKSGLQTLGENGKKYYQNNFTKEKRISQLNELINGTN